MVGIRMNTPRKTRIMAIDIKTLGGADLKGHPGVKVKTLNTVIIFLMTLMTS